MKNSPGRPPPSTEHFTILKPILRTGRNKAPDRHRRERTCPESEQCPRDGGAKGGVSNLQTSPRREDGEAPISEAPSGVPQFIDTIDAIDHLFNPLDGQKLKAVKYLEKVTSNDPSVSREIRLFGGIQRLCLLLRTPMAEMISPLINIFISITSGTGEVVEANRAVIMESKLNLICFIQYLNNENLSSDVPPKIIEILFNLSFHPNSYKSLFSLVVEPFERRINIFLDTCARSGRQGESSRPLERILDCFINFLGDDCFCKFSLLSRISIPAVLLEILKNWAIFENNLIVSKVFDILTQLSADFDPEYFQPDEKSDIFNCSNIKRRKKLRFGQNPQAIFWLSDAHDTFSSILTRNSSQIFISNILRIYTNLTSKNLGFNHFYRHQIRNNDGLLIILTFLEMKCRDVVIQTLELLRILVENDTNRDLVSFFGVKYFISCLNGVTGRETTAESEEVVHLVIGLFRKIILNRNSRVERNFIQRGGIRPLVELQKNKKFSKKINKILAHFWNDRRLRADAVKNGLTLDGRSQKLIKKAKKDDFAVHKAANYKNTVDLNRDGISREELRSCSMRECSRKFIIPRIKLT